jgi:HEAT repeat protein
MRRHRVALAVTMVLALVSPAAGQRPPGSAGELIRALQGRDFNEAFRAAEALGQMPAQRAQVVPALIDALRNRDWATCSADVRDAIGKSLAELKAKEAIGALLDHVKSGKPLGHDCVE